MSHDPVFSMTRTTDPTSPALYTALYLILSTLSVCHSILKIHVIRFFIPINIPSIRLRKDGFDETVSAVPDGLRPDRCPHHMKKERMDD